MFHRQLEENPAFFQGRRTILLLWQCLSPCQPTCQVDSTQGHIEHRDVSTHLSAKVLVCLSIKLEWLESRCPLTSRKLRLGEKTVRFLAVFFNFGHHAMGSHGKSNVFLHGWIDTNGPITSKKKQLLQHKRSKELHSLSFVSHQIYRTWR